MMIARNGMRNQWRHQRQQHANVIQPVGRKSPRFQVDIEPLRIPPREQNPPDRSDAVLENPGKEGARGGRLGIAHTDRLQHGLR